MMDLTKFATGDLMALQAGDMTKMSTGGLKILQSMQRRTKLLADNPGDYDPSSAEFQARNDPTQGMSGAEKFLAGAGKAFVDIKRGAGQIVGTETQANVDEAKRLDAPLMRTGAGIAGDVTGNIAMALPTAVIPGAQGVSGAALGGAAMGLLSPVASDESRLKNTVIGGVAGGGGVLAGRGLAALYQGGKALAQPFYQGGRETIAGRTLQRFGVDAADVAGASGAPTSTGARVPLAEQITRPEGAAAAARLTDSLRAADPVFSTKLAAREIENNAARVSTLKDLAGEGGARDFAEAMRNGTAKDLYGKAFATKMDPSTLSAAERGEVTKLLKVPALQDAMAAAKEIAANQGLSLAKPEGSIQGLHLMKLAMDDAIQAAGAGGSATAVNKAMSIKMARDRLVTFIERMSPDYGEARATYAAMSKPMNQADVAAEVLRAGTSSTSDLAGNARLMPNALTTAVRDEGRLIKRATGRDFGAKLEDVLEPAQLSKLRDVVGEVDRSAAVARAGNGPGSATAQRLAGTNILRQTLGPTGMPQSWAESTLLSTLMRPLQFAYATAEPRIQMTLADLLLDPSKAAAAMKAATPAARTKLTAVLEDPALLHAARLALPAAAPMMQR